MEREVPAKYTNQQKSLKRREYAWSTLHYVLGTAAVVLAFLAGSKAVSSKFGDDVASSMAVASGLVAAVLTFLSPASRRKAYTEARDLMRITRLRYEEEGEVRTVKELIDAMESALQMTRRR